MGILLLPCGAGKPLTAMKSVAQVLMTNAVSLKAVHVKMLA